MSPKHAGTSPVLTAPQIRALTLGRELHMWNIVRWNRAYAMRSAHFQRASMAFQSAYIFGIAQIDQNRRMLRDLLTEALAEVR